jgi:hypothetical protein
MRFFVGIVGFPLGLIIIIYRERIKRFTGDMEFFEKVFGIGGTYTGILVLGIAISIGSLMYMFGTLQAMLAGILAPFFAQ